MENKIQTLKESTSVKPEAYDSPSWLYDIRGFFILTFAYRDNLYSQASFFARNISSMHLEGAIGTGTLSLFMLVFKKLLLKKSPYHFIGIDYAPEMLKGAKKILKGKNIEVRHGDLTDLNYENGYFQSVNLANSFHTIKDIKPAIREISRVLVPKGTFKTNVLLYPKTRGVLDRISLWINAWGQEKGILFRPYERQEILQILEENNFQIEKITEKGNALYVTCIKQ